KNDKKEFLLEDDYKAYRQRKKGESQKADVKSITLILKKNHTDEKLRTTKNDLLKSIPSLGKITNKIQIKQRSRSKSIDSTTRSAYKRIVHSKDHGKLNPEAVLKPLTAGAKPRTRADFF